jgi:hypothetical protein
MVINRAPSSRLQADRSSSGWRGRTDTAGVVGVMKQRASYNGIREAIRLAREGHSSLLEAVPGMSVDKAHAFAMSLLLLADRLSDVELRRDDGGLQVNPSESRLAELEHARPDNSSTEDLMSETFCSTL